MGLEGKVDSKEIGLEAGLILGKYLLGTEHLHYGYWTEDLPLDIRNLARAQERHSEFVVSHIPRGAESVLDVGSGTGLLASRLLEKGLEVDCVSPSPFLALRVRKRLGERSRIYECSFEELRADRTYDVVLFSESFQYVKMEKALRNSLALLKPGGNLLICDLFDTDAPGHCAIGGGHGLSAFRAPIAALPFELVEDIDITKETAPNLDLVDEFLTTVGRPLVGLVALLLRRRHRLVYKILRWRFRRRIEKASSKYFSGDRNARNFAIFRTYRLLLYRKTAS